MFRGILRRYAVFLATLIAQRRLNVLLSAPRHPGRGVEVLRFMRFGVVELVVGGIVGYLTNHFRRRFGLDRFVGHRYRSQRKGGRVTHATFGPQVSYRGVGLVSLFVWRLVNDVCRAILRVVAQDAFFRLLFGNSLWYANANLKGAS